MKRSGFWIIFLLIVFHGFTGKGQVTVLSENFNGMGVPSGWAAINNSIGGTVGPDSAAWTRRSDGYHYLSVFVNRIFHSNDLSAFFLSNSDAQGDDSPEPKTNTILYLPIINTIGYSGITLKFYHNFWSASDLDSALVEASTDGINWTAIYIAHDDNGFEIGSSDDFEPQTITLDTYANLPNVYLRFHYLATWGNYWALDNVTITGVPTNACTTNNWEGTVSTAWDDPANWSCGSIPIASSIVNINTGKPRYPIINSVAACKILNCSPGTSVIINAGFRLDITGP
ncbi:MAG: hypothetical protein ABIY51_09620 [Ferruginibacter sp.]